MALDVQIQRNFGGGMFDNPALELIPENGLSYCRNGLFEEDGTVFKRGGSAYKTNTNLAGGTLMVWDGYLVAGPRTVVLHGDTITILDTDDETPFDVDSVGTDFASTRPAVVNGMLAMLTDSNGIVFYGGSRKTASYGLAGIDGTLGQRTLTRAAGGFTANVDPGMIASNLSGDIIGVVETVDSDTQVTLNTTLTANVTNAQLANWAQLPAFGIDCPLLAPPTAVASISSPARTVAAAGSIVAFTAAGSPDQFTETDYHRLPQGAQVLGMEALRNVLFVFTTQGVFTISGMDYDLTDAAGNPQHRLEQINRDILLLDQRGVAGWQNSLIVPAQDDIWMLSTASAPVRLSAPISRLWRAHVEDGGRVGSTAVFRGHLMVPLLDSTEQALKTLVCRLDTGAWSEWEGYGSLSYGFATRAATTAGPAALLSAAGLRIADMTGCFSPSSSNTTDAAGSPVDFRVASRPFTLNGLRKAVVKKFRVRYYLDAAGSADLNAFEMVTFNDPMTFTALSDAAPKSGAEESVYTWSVNKTGKFFAFFVRVNEACASAKVKSVEVFSRPQGRQ